MSPISDIWTLEPHGSPGAAATLAARGAISASIEWPNQAPGVLAITLSLAGGAGADLSTYPYDSRWVLRRSGEVFFRGRVRTAPRRSGSETVTLQLIDAWGELDDTPYTQLWDVVASDGSIEAKRMPRALLSPAASRQTSAQALATVIAAASAAGTTLGLSVSGLPSLTLPPIEAANLSCGELIRTILRYHPGATARIAYGTSGDTLQVRDRSTAPTTTFQVGAQPLADFDLIRRDDLVVDAVHVLYETAATRFNSVPGETEDDPATIRATRRLAVFEDIYPAGAAVTRRSLSVVLSAPALADPPPPPIPQMVAVKTRAIPEEGDNSAVAQRWWLDMLGLSVHGITVADVMLPGEGDEGQSHRIRFAWQADDPNDPLHEAPSAVNPASTVVWRPPSVADLPRQLISGTLAEWMRVEAAELAIDATVYLRKSAIDANAAALKVVRALSPRVGKLGAVDAYIVAREVRVIGTTAKTKVYKNWTATGSYNPGADALASIEEAREAAVVPGLARDLFQERTSAPWEGTIPLLQQEAGAARYLGRRINLDHPARTEWAAMNGLVQAESLDLTTGATTLRIGPPEHLTPQDRAELWQAARWSRSKRAESAVSAPVPSDTDLESDLDAPGRGGVFPGTVSPKLEVRPTEKGDSETRWDLIPSGAGYILRDPMVMARYGAKDSITITNSELTLAANKWVVATVDELSADPYSLTTAVVNAETDGSIEPYLWGSSDNLAAVRLPLHYISDVEIPGAVPIGDDLWSLKYVSATIQTLASHLVIVPGRPISRPAPRLVGL